MEVPKGPTIIASEFLCPRSFMLTAAAELERCAQHVAASTVYLHEGSKSISAEKQSSSNYESCRAQHIRLPLQISLQATSVFSISTHPLTPLDKETIVGLVESHLWSLSSQAQRTRRVQGELIEKVDSSSVIRVPEQNVAKCANISDYHCLAPIPLKCK